MAQCRLDIVAAIFLFVPALLKADGVGIDLVVVGDPGNAPDTTGYGAVAYPFRMGKFDVTAGQYCAFLNAVAASDTYGLYSTSMDVAVDPYGCNIKRTGQSGTYVYSVAADWANRPVNFVSWGDAARFANWLSNGQPAGEQGPTTTEGGSYSLNGASDLASLMTITRNAGARFVIPSEDEWYKAAYYDPAKSGGAGYWAYPTRNNTVPINVLSATATNNANFHDLYGTGNHGYTIDSPYWRTEVGAFAGSPSAYGTFDQGGNVFQWVESVHSGSYRVLRGGSFNGNGFNLQTLFRAGGYPTNEVSGTGFRVAGLVPRMIAAVSRRTHGIAGDFDLNVLSSGAVECREGGAKRVIVTFDRAVQQVGGTVADVQASRGMVTSLAVDGSALDVRLDGADEAGLLVLQFPGIADAAASALVVCQSLCIRILPGDASGDGAVNSSDYIAVRGFSTQPVDTQNFRNDVNCDGGINSSDYVVIRARVGTFVPKCP